MGTTVKNNVFLVAMVTIVINHVMGVYLTPVIRKKVYVEIELDVSLGGSTDSRGSVIKYVNQGHLEITALRTATVSVNANVIKQLVYVLLVDVNVDTKGLPVVQNAVMVTMVSIAIDIVMGVYLMTVMGTLVYVQIYLAANLESSLDRRNVI